MLRETCAGLAALPLLILGAAGEAAAAPPKVIEGEEILSGEHLFSEVIVKQGGRLRVRPAASDPAAGWVHLKAGRIVVEAGGAIDATGAGYPGADAANGAQPMEVTNSAGLFPMSAGRPGSGGAHAGAGAAGVTATCAPFAEPPGGSPYPDLQTLLAAGSAGGALHVLDPADASAPSRGGHGGGRVTLEAAEIEIAGEVLALGGDGIAFKELGSGAGAGGLVQIRTPKLTGDGVISVMGGRGGEGTGFHGGGGGGGLVILRVPGASQGALAVHLGGGSSGPCTGVVGGDGVESLVDEPTCLDVDGDGHAAASCGGDDCDDGDAAIHPGATDATCDGVDNDCNGAADDAVTEAACPDLHTCQAGQCVPTDGGAGGGGSGPGSAPPERLEYRGGCAVGAASDGIDAAHSGPEGSRSGAGSAGALLGLGLIGMLARRRRVVVRAKVS